ncbi:MAG: sialate O-acetylesterase [Chitinophagales bacterium]|nr:sialate O-acetylesterase [Chitinophagales bacterium]
MRYIIATVFLMQTFYSFCQDNQKENFPVLREEVKIMPERENVWIFLMAGQSNMAGRGFVEPSDTISSHRIISLGENNIWYYAKEPLHFYEPNLTGLDCGLSFAKELLKYIPENISIGLIPCAVGGSSIQQWNNDETYRGVTLLSNFKERLEEGKNKGIIKGVLWHQGESDANSIGIPPYAKQTTKLFAAFRQMANNEKLPILVGELGSFRQPAGVQAQCDSINQVIHQTARLDKYRFVIPTGDLGHKGDNLHFNSSAQREMGIRFAQKYNEVVLNRAKHK